MVQQIQSLVSQLRNDISFAANNIIGPVQNYISQQIQSLYSSFLNAVNFASNNIISPIQNYLTSSLNTLRSDLLGIGATISNSVVAPLQNFLTSYVLQPLRNIGTYVASGFNQLATGLNIAFTDITNSLNNLGSAVVKGLQEFINTVVEPFFSQVGSVIQGYINFANSWQQRLLDFAIPRDPEGATAKILNDFVNLGEFIAGSSAAIALIENVHPFHSLNLSQHFKNILEWVGVYDISQEAMRLWFNQTYGLQLEYLIKHSYNVIRIDPNTSKMAVWYGERDVTQYKDDLQFEGFDNDNIDAHVKTLYKPLPPFILERLISLQIGTPDFYTKQLLKEGFDPSDVPTLLQIFQNLSITGFQANAKSLIFLMYKDGYISSDTAMTIMKALVVPDNEQKWILQLANYQYQYEQKLTMQSVILDDVKKGLYKDPQGAISDLVALGLSADRATLLVKKEAVTSFITLKAQDKQALLQSFSAIIGS